MRDINALIIHVTATPPSMVVGIDMIDSWHVAIGMDCVAYHYNIGRDGTIEEGRPLEKPGAHARGHNTHSIGICLEGGVKEDKKTPDSNFTRAQLKSLDKLLTELLERFPASEVFGHRDLPGVTKACPCFDVRAWWYG